MILAYVHSEGFIISKNRFPSFSIISTVASEILIWIGIWCTISLCVMNSLPSNLPILSEINLDVICNKSPSKLYSKLTLVKSENSIFISLLDLSNSRCISLVCVFFSKDKSNLKLVGIINNSELNASVISILPAPAIFIANSLPYWSVTNLDVVINFDLISWGVKSGFLFNNNATAPETCGAA